MQQGTVQPSPVFIVGTGRCGSTMLSTMLREHPAILSLSEFFAFVTDFWCRNSQAFPDGVIDAEHFWRILSTCYAKQHLLLRHDIKMDELLYPYTSSTARYDAQTGVPPILQTALPHLTPDYDALFDEIQTVVATFPPAPIQDHYQHLFTWLLHRFDRQVWIERSGSSLHSIALLYQHFPHARFVHIVRDGRNCALSISRHNGFRLAFVAGYMLEAMGCDPFEDTDRSRVERLPAEFHSFLPEQFDVEAFRAFEVPTSFCGFYWSGELQQGLNTLVQIPQENVLTLRYEDFFVEPEKQLRELMTFIHPTYADEHWIQQAASTVRPAHSSWETLPTEEQELLDQVCQPGLESLQSFLQKSVSPEIVEQVSA